MVKNDIDHLLGEGVLSNVFWSKFTTVGWKLFTNKNELI